MIVGYGHTFNLENENSNCEPYMGFCKRCGRPIDDQYLYCYECNLTADTYKDENGYERYKDSDLLVHRVVAEQKLGRPLEPWEVVHHKDRNKLNNDPRNLWSFAIKMSTTTLTGRTRIDTDQRLASRGFRISGGGEKSAN